MNILGNLHLLRPEWLWALLPLGVLLILARRRGVGESRWHQVIPKELLQHLIPQGTRLRRRPLLSLSLVWLITVIALAGPAWQKQPQPLQTKADHLVVILDLSLSTLATDLQPNRLTRAKQKLSDLLQQRQEGQTALVVYAGDSHVVSPLTDDSATVLAMVPALDPFIMPALGSRPERAVAQAIGLLENAAVPHGRLLLLTDDMTTAQATQIKALLKPTPYRLSIIAIGTAAGGPIQIPERGFLQDNRGQVIIPSVNEPLLKELAQDLGGGFASISLDNRDLDATLGNGLAEADYTQQDSNLNFDLWQDEGYWLVLLVIPLALWLYRRGAFLALFLGLGFFPQPSEAFEWQSLWKTQDQRGQQAYQSGQFDEAATLFERPDWKGSALYRAGNYEAAAQEFAGQQTPDSFYNLGNSLAQAQQYEQAIAAYEQALALQPDHEAARHNKDLIERFLQQQQQQQQQQQGEQNPDEQSGQQGSEQPQPDSSGQPGDDLPTEQQPSQPNQEPGTDSQPEPQAQDMQAAQPTPPDEPGQAQEDGALADAPLDQEQQQANEQWLRRVPDDPGGLLKRKFELQYRERGYQERQPTDQPIW